MERGWEWEESGRRGFACPREWKARVTAKEWEELRFLCGRFPFGADRHDLGLVKAAYATATAMGWKGEPEALFPVEQPAQEQTLEDAFNEMFAFSKSHNQKFNGHDNRNPGSEAQPG